MFFKGFRGLPKFSSGDMSYHRKNYGLYIIIGILGVVLTVFALGQVSFSWAAINEPEPDVFSLKCEKWPLIKVIDEISKKTGNKIIINEEWAKWPVTVTLKQISTVRALKRILGRLNHAIIYGAGNRISVIILGESNLGFDASNSFDPLDIEVVPPDRPGDKGITQRELNQILAQRKKIDPLDLEVVPPDKPGEKAITQRELNELKSKQEKPNPLSIEVVPPDEPGGKGVTQQEYEAIRASQKKVDILDLEVVPPNKTGQKGITQRELNKLKSVGSTE